MKLRSTLLGATGVIALVAASATPALADGTQAGSTITNTATVNYKVNGFDQNAETATDTITVDRKIDLVVTEVGETTTQVSPGELAAVTTFDVTNLSNDTLDFALAAVQSVATRDNGGADTFDANNVRIYVDNGDGIFDANTDTEIDYIDELGIDQTARVFVVADIPLDDGGNPLVSGDVATVTLTATALEGGDEDVRGASITETVGANTANEDTVFADGAGDIDAARDASFSDTDDYTVLAAALTVLKTSRVISDPVNLTNDPKLIPGATVQYCIRVSNAADSAAATDVAVVDILSALPLTYVANSAFVNGTVNGGTDFCEGGTAAAYDAGTETVSGTIPSVSAGDTRVLYFEATID